MWYSTPSQQPTRSELASQHSFLESPGVEKKNRVRSLGGNTAAVYSALCSGASPKIYSDTKNNEKKLTSTHRVHGSSRKARGLPRELNPPPEGGHRPLQAPQVHHLPQVQKPIKPKNKQNKHMLTYSTSLGPRCPRSS